MGDGSKHLRIVVVELRGLILESDNFEALTADTASMNWSFSYKVEHLFVRVGIIFDTWSHANDNSPGGVRGEDEDWIVDSSELSVDCGFHLMPLIQLKSVVSDGGREVCCGVTMHAVAIWEL